MHNLMIAYTFDSPAYEQRRRFAAIIKIRFIIICLAMKNELHCGVRSCEHGRLLQSSCLSSVEDPRGMQEATHYAGHASAYLHCMACGRAVSVITATTKATAPSRVVIQRIHHVDTIHLRKCTVGDLRGVIFWSGVKPLS